ncbi:MAG: isoprenyl transferase [Opitutales bacterium]|nr:isoprenyl transferase [Opitutales bacterium]
MPEAKPESHPRHVAIIMDGNGRWAQRRGLARIEGHEAGVENVKRIVEAAREQDLRYLTLYAFSVENWKRPTTEVNALMQLLDQFLSSQSEEMIQKEIRLRVIGQLGKLPGRIRNKIQKTIDATAHFDRWNLTLALNYGSRTEILDAVKAYAQEIAKGREKPRQLDWEQFSQYLYTTDLPDPDLVIRTSGEHRVSNFLLLQSAYAEYYFADECWPDFGKEAFAEALKAYACRQRRFGLTGEQILSQSS